ncbi:MAG: 5'-nucleotidase C-terminal domain-containing protein [Flavobacteriaceae bacterium]
MHLKIKHFVVFITFIGLISCREGQKKTLTSIQAEEVLMDSTIKGVDAVEKFVAPYRTRINEVLDAPLAYAPYDITKTDGDLNTSAGNLLVDAIFDQANPIYKEMTGHAIDFVLMNHGGIRADIPQGDVNTRTAYQVMPFENSIVVVQLPGKAVLGMVEYLVKSKRAHPISKMQVILDNNHAIKSLSIQGKPFEEQRTYHVATSNYLVSGGDDMVFFKGMTGTTDTGYLIRNALVDYFTKVDTLTPRVDDRFIKTSP